MAKRFLPRTRSFRSTAASKASKGEDGVSLPDFVGSDAQPLDDPNNLHPNIKPPVRDSTSWPKTANSPEWRLKPNTPTQSNQHSKWDFEFSSLSSSHAMDSPTGAEDMYIGMALGSPSQTPNTGAESPLPPLPIETEEYNVLSSVSSEPSMSVPKSNVSKAGDFSKQRTKWKMFGAIFGKKTDRLPESPASPVHHLQHTPPVRLKTKSTSPHIKNPADTDAEALRYPSLSNKVLGRGGDVTKNKHTQKHRPQKLDIELDIARAKSVPMLQHHNKSPTPPPKDSCDSHSSKYSRKGGPMMLQVDIPDVAMDRYSVMFGSVLQTSQSSLLTRRQVHLETLISTGDERPSSESLPKSDDGFLKPTRRATSPEPRSKSPSFSLFPSTPSSRHRTPSPQQLGRRSPLQRSATVPLAASPMRPTFDLSHSPTKDQSAVIVMVHSPAHSPDTPISSYKAKWSSDWSPTSTEASLPEEQTSDQIRREEALYSLKLSNSPCAQAENAAPSFVLSPPPIKRRETPEGTRMIGISDSPASSYYSAKSVPDLNIPTDPPSTTSQGRALIQDPISTASVKTAAIPQKFNSAATTSPLTSSPPSEAEISIARQISLSRRQRHVVVPIIPKTVRQPMQATLVDVVTDEKSGGEKNGHVSRKSHHVLLEDA